MEFLKDPLRFAAVALGGSICALVLLIALAASDLSFSVYDTVLIEEPTGPVVVTRYNAIAILALTALFCSAIAGLLSLAAKMEPSAADIVPLRSPEVLWTDADSVSAIYGKLIDVHGTYADRLMRFNASLEGEDKAADVERIVRELISEHQRIRDETNSLTEELKSTQVEKQSIEDKLSQVEAEGHADAMTGIGNRRSFDRELQAAIATCRATRQPLSLVMADIDHFKRFNDTYGHQVGDEVIKLLAKVISNSVRERDIAARYGGEEFGIIMPAADLDAAKAVAERIRKDLETQTITLRTTGASVGTVTASFGVAVLQEADDADSLIRRADERLYDAKAAGRNRVLS